MNLKHFLGSQSNLNKDNKGLSIQGPENVFLKGWLGWDKLYEAYLLFAKVLLKVSGSLHHRALFPRVLCSLSSTGRYSELSGVLPQCR